MVPQIVEKVYQVEKFIETVNVEGKLELSKKERIELKKQIRAEVDSEIHMLTENILAYQELLFAKDEELAMLAKDGKGAGVRLDYDETLRIKLVEANERILILEDQIAKQCDGGGEIKARIFKKVEHLNVEVEKRLEKIHEHYQSKWRTKSEDFIAEIADHKARINCLIEEKEIMMKKLSYTNGGGGDEKMITYYKQLIVSKDCEIETFRNKLNEYET